MTDMTKKHNTLGGKIQRCRKGLGISQEELAQRLGVSRQSVAKWETGQSVPDLNRLVTLADILGASLDYLLRDTIPQDAFATAVGAPAVQALATPQGARSEIRFADGTLDAAEPADTMPFARENCCPPAVHPEEEVQPEPDTYMDGADPDTLEQTSCNNVGTCAATGEPQLKAGSMAALRSGAGHAQVDSSREPFGFSTRRLVAACGLALVTVGIVGLATLWVLSETHPVQLTMWDGSLREGVWGFVLAHNLDNVFFATCGTALGGIILLGGVWVSSRRAR